MSRLLPTSRYLPVWWVYVVRCRDGSLYCGIAKDVERRVRQHNAGPRGSRYTRSRRPVKLVWRTPRTFREDALRLERRFKRLSRVKKELVLRGEADVDERTFSAGRKALYQKWRRAVSRPPKTGRVRNANVGA